MGADGEPGGRERRELGEQQRALGRLRPAEQRLDGIARERRGRDGDRGAPGEGQHVRLAERAEDAATPRPHQQGDAQSRNAGGKMQGDDRRPDIGPHADLHRRERGEIARQREAEPRRAERVAGTGEAGAHAARPRARHRTRRDRRHAALLSNSRISRPNISVMVRTRREFR